MTALFRRRVNPRGVTMVELLVAVTIVIGLAAVIFNLLKYASNTRAIASARGTAKTEVEVALRQITRDLSRAKAPTVTDALNGQRALATTPTSTQFTVTEPTPTGVQEISIKYTWNLGAKTLVREANGVSHTYSTHLKKMWMDYAENDPDKFGSDKPASGTVLVVMETEVVPEGKNPPQIHHQEIMVAIQGEMSKNIREKWRSPEDFTSSFYQ